MSKKKSKVEVIEEKLHTAEFSGWCVVDTDNKFSFNSEKFQISSDVKQYLVLNKAKKEFGTTNDYLNEASMSTILVIDDGDEIQFYDENLTEVKSEMVKLI